MERYYAIPEGDDLIRKIRNAREEAIYDVLGGINAATEKLGVRRQSVHYLLTQPRIRDTDTAKRLAEATAREGRPVPVAEILDLEPWRGPERHGSDPSRRRKGEFDSSDTSEHQIAVDEPAHARAAVAQTLAGSLQPATAKRRAPSGTRAARKAAPSTKKSADAQAPQSRASGRPSGSSPSWRPPLARRRPSRRKVA